MSLEKKIHEYLIENEKTLAIAESCSGGLLSSKFTVISQASKYFLGSVVAYSKEMKHHVLKVSNETLRISGAVSREVTDEMLLGILKLADPDYGIALTGIAGPTGGTKEKPVGTVFIALGAHEKKPHVVDCHFKGSRIEIIEAACERALTEFARWIGLS